MSILPLLAIIAVALAISVCWLIPSPTTRELKSAEQRMAQGDRQAAIKAQQAAVQARRDAARQYWAALQARASASTASSAAADRDAAPQPTRPRPGRAPAPAGNRENVEQARQALHQAEQLL